jgi:hypothetical protein
LTNEDFTVRFRLRRKTELGAWETILMEDGRFRGVTVSDGVETELWDLIPTQGVDGYITATVPQATMAAAPAPCVAAYDVAVEWEDGSRVAMVEGTVDIGAGVSEW